ncbi:uncharacterized protein At2g29880-like [Macadamia integrifolia]|uniref:uncharacterized protein At2g29880-like n=1 Tax=Macadamia integrifolia TaxID=60698 RepID=UPI001C4FD8CE|nr:uncharacterized protein At2g29880-like [Macadamia integrifolia]
MSTSKQAVNETAKWSQANVDTLIVLMVEEVKKGNRTTSTFNKAGWNNIANNFKEKIGVNYAIIQLKNKVNKLRQDYSQFKKLLETTGFGWDTASRTCTVDDESIWESHIKDNPTWHDLRSMDYHNGQNYVWYLVIHMQTAKEVGLKQPCWKLWRPMMIGI